MAVADNIVADHDADVQSHFVYMKVLLDIGAGQGLFSLAAAARGHKALAFELSAKSLASLEASIAFSSLHHLVDVHEVILLFPRHLSLYHGHMETYTLHVLSAIACRCSIKQFSGQYVCLCSQSRFPSESL